MKRFNYKNRASRLIENAKNIILQKYESAVLLRGAVYCQSYVKIICQMKRLSLFKSPFFKALSCIWLLILLAGCSSSSYTLKSGSRFVFIGDSITDGDWCLGNGRPSVDRLAREWDKNHIYGHSYMAFCAACMQADYPGQKYEFFNRGFSGNRLEHLEKRWDTDVIALRPDVVTILIGTNDVSQYLSDADPGVIPDASGFDAGAWEKSYRALLDRTLASNPDVRFVLCSPFVEKVGDKGRHENYPVRKELVGKLSSVIKGITSDYNAVFLPFGEMFDELQESPDLPSEEYWIWDGIHPTYAGSWKMSKLWLELITHLP